MSNQKSSKKISRRKALKSIGVTAAAVSLSTTLTPKIAKAKSKKIKWRIQTHWPTGVAYYDAVYVDFCNRVKEASGGEIEIQPFPPNSIVPTKDVFDAVGRGLFEMALLWPSYWTGKLPVAAHVNGFPFTWKNLEEAGLFFYEMGAIDIIRKAYAEHNLFQVGPVFLNGIVLYSKKPLHTLKDFKGFKVRSTGPIQKMFQLAGATPVFFPGSELYSALQRGVCDGAHWGAVYAGWDMKLQEVTSYIVMPYLANVNNGEIFINLKAWKKLPRDYQELILNCARANSTHCMEWFVYKDFQCLDEYQKKNLGKISWLDDDTVKKLREFSIKVIDSFSKRDPKYCGEVGKLLKKYLKMSGQI